MAKRIFSALLVAALLFSVFTLTATAAAEAKITVTLNVSSVILRGTAETYQLIAKVTNSKKAVTWVSDNEKVATVDTKGLVTPLKTGNVSIFATVEGVSAVAKITVDNRGNTSGNITNGGLVAQSGDWIYYAGNDNKLYKIKSDGTEKTKLSDDKARCINVFDGWIYYSNESDMMKYGVSEGGKPYRIKTDGTGREKINDDATQDINVVGNMIYYIGTNKGITRYIYKMNTDGSGKITLRNSGPNYGLMVSGSYVYYTRFNFTKPTGDQIHKINASDGKGETRVTTDKIHSAGSQKSSQIIGDWIYYTSFNNKDDGYTGLNNYFRIKTDGSDREFLFGGSWNSIGQNPANVVGNVIYFADSKNGTSLHKIGINGKDKVKMTEDKVKQICVVDDWIYYTDNSDIIYRIRTNGNDRQKV